MLNVPDVVPLTDHRSEAEDGGAWRCEETSPKEGPYVCWLHAGGPAGRETQGHNGPEVQPQAGQEGGQGGGEEQPILSIKSSANDGHC